MDNDEIQPAPRVLADLEPEIAPKRRHPGRWIVGVVAVVAISGATVALTNKDDTKSPTVVLSEAASRTTGSGTAHFSLTGSLTAAGKHLKVLEGEGIVDYGKKENEIVLKTGGLTEYTRTLNGVSYLSVDGIELPHGTHWVAITPADAKLDPNAQTALGSNDPSSGLEFFSAIDGNPRVVGTETADGIKVTHYAFTIDMKSYFARLGKAADALKASSLGSSLEALGSYMDLSSIPGEAWIDGAGRVRKFEILLNGSVQGQSFKGIDEFQFSHFDEPVNVEAPAASDTVPFHDVPDFMTKVGAAAAAAGGPLG
jgi:hypothetical protein